MTQTPLQGRQGGSESDKEGAQTPGPGSAKSFFPFQRKKKAQPPIPASAPTQRPAAIEQPDATRFGDLDAAAPAIKTGRLPRKSKTLAPEL
jgi:hypothetical protein